MPTHDVSNHTRVGRAFLRKMSMATLASNAQTRPAARLEELLTLG